MVDHQNFEQYMDNLNTYKDVLLRTYYDDLNSTVTDIWAYPQSQIHPTP